MKKPRRKKCKACGESFQPTQFAQIVCKPFPCSIDYAKDKAKKADDKARRERKQELKPISHWLNITQKVFNEFIRIRDYREPCISCGNLDSPEWCAGHFRTRGAASNLRFDEDNAHKQCNRHCNLALSGNVAEYRPKLIAKIGQERVDALENNNESKKWDYQELKLMRTHYSKKIKELEAVL